jgi:hypothetical protein
VLLLRAERPKEIRLGALAAPPSGRPQPPSTECNASPDELDDPERPGARQEAVDARQNAASREAEYEPPAPILEGIHRHHERERDDSEGGDSQGPSGSRPASLPALRDGPHACGSPFLGDTRLGPGHRAPTRLLGLPGPRERPRLSAIEVNPSTIYDHTATAAPEPSRNQRRFGFNRPACSLAATCASRPTECDDAPNGPQAGRRRPGPGAAGMPSAVEPSCESTGAPGNKLEPPATPVALLICLTTPDDASR